MLLSISRTATLGARRLLRAHTGARAAALHAAADDAASDEASIYAIPERDVDEAAVHQLVERHVEQHATPAGRRVPPEHAAGAMTPREDARAHDDAARILIHLVAILVGLEGLEMC